MRDVRPCALVTLLREQQGIAAFTTLFAAGQIIGPTLVGWVADGAGCLRGGPAVLAGVLLLGALVTAGQKPLD